jgi:hypothetical protein
LRQWYAMSRPGIGKSIKYVYNSFHFGIIATHFGISGIIINGQWS